MQGMGQVPADSSLVSECATDPEHEAEHGHADGLLVSEHSADEEEHEVEHGSAARSPVSERSTSPDVIEHDSSVSNQISNPWSCGSSQVLLTEWSDATSHSRPKARENASIW